jgi:NAD(P)H-dependent FMN reductase
MEAYRMKMLVVFYSYSGTAKRIAINYAVHIAAETVEVADVKRPGIFKAYTGGCLAAMHGKAGEIEPITFNLAAYDRLVLFTPIWASNTPPAFNALLALLPTGKMIDIKTVSGGGRSGAKCKERIAGILHAKGCTLESYEDLKASTALKEIP